MDDGVSSKTSGRSVAPVHVFKIQNMFCNIRMI